MQLNHLPAFIQNLKRAAWLPSPRYPRVHSGRKMGTLRVDWRIHLITMASLENSEDTHHEVLRKKKSPETSARNTNKHIFDNEYRDKIVRMFNELKETMNRTVNKTQEEREQKQENSKQKCK